MEEKNYTEFSEITEVTENNEIVENNETVEEPVQNIGDEIVENLEENNVESEFETFTVTVEENVNDIEVQNTTTVVIEPEVEEEEEPVTDDVVPATLKGCTKLNMRKEASKDSEVVCVITKDSTITVSIGNSTEDFYKVNTIVKDVLVEGYCMKQFIDVE